MLNALDQSNSVHVYRKIIIDEAFPKDAIGAFCTAYSSSSLHVSGKNGTNNNVSYVSDERVSASVADIASYLLSQSIVVGDVMFDLPCNVPNLQTYETEQGSKYFILRRPLNQEEHDAFVASFNTYAN